MHWKSIIRFWFQDKGREDWFFKKSPKLDREIRKKFLDLHGEIARGEHAAWRGTPKGRLAEIIVLDQFSRNMFRGTAKMFAFDPLALVLSQEAVRLGVDTKLSDDEKLFLYLPFEHSESKKIQKESVRLFRMAGISWVVPYALDHKRIIDRFGRFPHRNAILGRKSTVAEKKFMRVHKGY